MIVPSCSILFQCSGVQVCNESEASVGDPIRSLVDVIATRCAQAKQVPCLTLHGIRWDQVFAAGSVAEYARLYLFAQLRGAIAHQIRLLLTPSEAAFFWVSWVSWVRQRILENPQMTIQEACQTFPIFGCCEKRLVIGSKVRLPVPGMQQMGVLNARLADFERQGLGVWVAVTCFGYIIMSVYTEYILYIYI